MTELFLASIDIEAAFSILEQRLTAFDHALAHCDRPFAAPQLGDTTNAQKTALRALMTDIWHHHDGDGRRTRSHWGLIGADDALIMAAHALNDSKQHFKQMVGALNHSQQAGIHPQLQRRQQALAAALHHQGLARLHLKQCYRQIPVLDSRPDKIRFSWYSSGRSIRRVTAKEAMQMLLKLDQSQPHIVLQIQRLSPLAEHTPLAQIQTQVPLIRANFAWKRADRQWHRQARNCPLPILIPLQKGDTLPAFNPLPEHPPEQRSRALRADSLIDPEPFLPSLRIHLYTSAP